MQICMQSRPRKFVGCDDRYSTALAQVLDIYHQILAPAIGRGSDQQALEPREERAPTHLLGQRRVTSLCLCSPVASQQAFFRNP